MVLGWYSWYYTYLLGLLVGVAATLSLVKSSWYLKLCQAKTGILVSGVSLLVSIGVVELALRLVDPLGISYYELAGNYVRDKLADDQLIFRHKPSWEARYGDVRVTYNERGLRDRPILPKAAGEYRILALGDSVTFGWGVDQDKTFTARLESLLQGRLHRPVRVINSGVGGYNTVQEVTYFKQEGINLQPDLVMLTYVQNDIEVNKGPFDPWTQSSLWGKPFPDMLETMVRKLWLFRLAHHTYRYAIPKQVKEEPSAPSQNGMGWRASMSALGELIEMCEERRIPLILFFERLDPRDNNLLLEDVVRHAKGVPVKDMAPWFAGLRIASHVNSKVDGHPNGEGHRVMAEHMAEDIVGYLVQLTDRASRTESRRMTR
ncbi:MAG: SGNH/GDSL hydrolase family protein [Nitrospira sp.]|nr:SGNH/GDSL hydrolase family protein [Nitrospira sp.]